MSPSQLREVKVVLRERDHERAWMVEINEDVEVGEILPDLMKALPIKGQADNYTLTWEGTLKTPRLLLTRVAETTIGRVRDDS